MLIRKVSLACTTMVAALSSSWAQTLPTLPTDPLRQEQERLRQDQEKSRSQQRPSGVNLEALVPPSQGQEVRGPCSDIRTIELQGATKLSDLQQAEVLAGYQGRCLSAFDIQHLMGKLTQQYINAGFITTRVYLPAQDLRRGELRILVQEGRIEKMEVRGDDAGRIHLGLTVPARAGDVLNIRDLEQAVDQINAAPGNKVRLDLKPGSQPGQTVVVFENQASKPINLFVGFDNMGAQATGRNSASATVMAGSLLGGNETLSATLRSSILPTTRDHLIHSGSVSYSQPIGYWTLGANYAHSYFSTGFDIPYPIGSITSYVRGDSIMYGVSVDRVFARSQNALHRATLELGTVDGKSRFEQPQNQVSQFLAASSRRTSSATLSTRSVWLLPQTMITLSPQMTWGIGSKSYLTGINSERQGNADFTKYALNLNVQHAFQAAGQSWTWGSELRTQYSTNNLVSSQKMLIGGVTSVRGFLDSSLTGDYGYVWRNDISLKKAYQWGAETVQTRFYVGLDMGQVKARLADSFDGRLAGGAVGVAASWGRVDADLSWARSLSRPDWMEAEPARLLVRLNYRY